MLVVVTFLFFSALVLIPDLLEREIPNALADRTAGDWAETLYGLCLTVVSWYFFLFMLWGGFISLVHVYRTADINELLPPIIGAVLAWEVALIDLFTSAYTGVPFQVRAALIFGGPLSVTAVSAWEMWRLRRFGITLRRALGR